jgi:hypothetical protein
MSAVPFDALKFSEQLKAGGFTDQQAKATTEAFAAATSQELATKADMHDLRRDPAVMEQRLTVKTGGMLLALAGLILATIRYMFLAH